MARSTSEVGGKLVKLCTLFAITVGDVLKSTFLATRTELYHVSIFVSIVSLLSKVLMQRPH